MAVFPMTQVPRSPRGGTQMPPLRGVFGQPLMDGYPRTLPVGQGPPAPFAPEPIKQKPFERTQPAYGNLGNSSYLAMNSDWMSRMQKLSAPNSPQNFRQMPTAASSLNEDGSVFKGVRPDRVFRNPELAGEVTPQTYFGMQNAIDSGNQTAATTRQNINTYKQMGVPNRGLEAAQDAADRVLVGLPAQAPLGPVGRWYGNTPLAGAPAVQPRYGQTVQGAQQSYLDTMAQARANTQARVGQMLAGGGQYSSLPGSPTTGRIGTMQSNVPGGMANDIIRFPNGGTLIQGSIPRAEWNGMASNLPGANGRTNGDMYAALQERLAARRGNQRAERIVARAPMNGLNAQTPAVRSAMMQLGIPIPGEPRRGAAGTTAAAPTGVAGHQQRIGSVVTSPLGQSIGLTASPNDIDLNFRRLLQSPPAASDQDRQAIVGMLESQMAMLPKGGTPQQRAQLEAYRQGGVPRLGLAIGSHEGSPQYNRNQQYRPQIQFAGSRVGY